MGGRFFGAETMRARKAAGLPRSMPCEPDFGQTFVLIGRDACKEHYGVGKKTVDRWLDECGKQFLIDARAEFVRQRQEEQRKADKLKALARSLSRAFPVEDRRIVSHELASAAAQHLRIRRNGGMFVSPTGAGDWWIGLRRCSAAELVDFAVARGFDRASLRGDDQSEVGSG